MTPAPLPGRLVEPEHVEQELDRFRCAPYSAVITARSCTRRRALALADQSKLHPVDRARGDYGLCSACPVGPVIAARIGEAEAPIPASALRRGRPGRPPRPQAREGDGVTIGAVARDHQSIRDNALRVQGMLLQDDRTQTKETAPAQAPKVKTMAGTEETKHAQPPRKVVVLRCKKCGKPGHNSRSCGREPKGMRRPVSKAYAKALAEIAPARSSPKRRAAEPKAARAAKRVSSWADTIEALQAEEQKLVARLEQVRTARTVLEGLARGE